MWNRVRLSGTHTPGYYRSWEARGQSLHFLSFTFATHWIKTHPKSVELNFPSVFNWFSLLHVSNRSFWFWNDSWSSQTNILSLLRREKWNRINTKRLNVGWYWEHVLEHKQWYFFSFFFFCIFCFFPLLIPAMAVMELITLSAEELLLYVIRWGEVNWTQWSGYREIDSGKSDCNLNLCPIK